MPQGKVAGYDYDNTYQVWNVKGLLFNVMSCLLTGCDKKVIKKIDAINRTRFSGLKYTNHYAIL